MKRKISAKTIAITAILTALEIIFVFVQTPPIAGATLAFCLVPVLVSAMTQKKGVTAFLSVLMACGMLVSAYTVGAGSLLAPVFRNPLVAIPPRLMVGVVANLSYHGLNKRVDRRFNVKLAALPPDSVEYKATNRKKQAAVYGVSGFTAFVGTLTNTALVCLMIWLCYIVGDMEIDSALLPQFFQVTLAVNASIEVAAFTILVPPIVAALHKAGYGVNKGVKSVRAAAETQGAAEEASSKATLIQEDEREDALTQEDIGEDKKV